MTDANDDAERWRYHLDQLLAKPGTTIVLGGVAPGGGMSMQTGGLDPKALLWMARSLIEQAMDAGGDAYEECCEAALEALPDPHADDDDSEDQP